jgi:hypothetical protein
MKSDHRFFSFVSGHTASAQFSRRAATFRQWRAILSLFEIVDWWFVCITQTDHD